MEKRNVFTLYLCFSAGKTTTNEEIEEMLESGNLAVFTQDVSIELGNLAIFMQDVSIKLGNLAVFKFSKFRIGKFCSINTECKYRNRQFMQLGSTELIEISSI